MDYLKALWHKWSFYYMLQMGLFFVETNTLDLKQRHGKYHAMNKFNDNADKKYFLQDKKLVNPVDTADKAKGSESNQNDIDHAQNPILRYSFSTNMSDFQMKQGQIGAILFNQLPKSYFCDHQLPPSRICDPLNKLKPIQAKLLEEAISDICSGTGCPCRKNCSTVCAGYKVSVLILPNILNELSRSPLDKDYLELAEALQHTYWDHSDCQEDVVIVLNTNTSQIYSSVGRTAAARLTPLCSKEVVRDAQIYLDKHLQAEALLQITRDYKEVFLQNFKCVLERDFVMPTGRVIGIIFGSVCIPIMICVVSVFLGPCFRGRGFGGKKHKTTYSKYRYHAHDGGAMSMATDEVSLGDSGRFPKGMTNSDSLSNPGKSVVML